MEQIAVVKITKTPSGEIRRNMMLPKNIWEEIVNGEAVEANVTWQLRKVEPVILKETKIINEEVREVELIAKEIPAEKKEESVSPADRSEEDKPKRAYSKRK